MLSFWLTINGIFSKFSPRFVQVYCITCFKLDCEEIVKKSEGFENF